MPPIDGVEQAPVPFVEQTKTVIVFANGAVLRLSEGVFPGQILIVKNLKNERESACRVISSKSIGNVQGYIEVEFTHATTDFWEGNAASSLPQTTSSAPVEAVREIEAPAPKPMSAPEKTEDDAMSKALADAFSSLISPSSKPAPQPVAATNTVAHKPAGSTYAGPPETMRSPGPAAKNPAALQNSTAVDNERASIFSNAKPLAIGDSINASVKSSEADVLDSSFKPASAYRGIEPRKSSMAPEQPAPRVSPQAFQKPAPVQTVAARPHRSGSGAKYMIFGVAAAISIIAGAFVGYRWYMNGGAAMFSSAAPTAAASGAATTNSNASTPVKTAAVAPAVAEPERVVVRATPLDTPTISSPAKTRAAEPQPTSSKVNTNEASGPAPKPSAPAAATPGRQSSILTMKMASPKAPSASVRQANVGNVPLPDIANPSSPNSSTMPVGNLGGALLAPLPGTVVSNMVQPKLLSSVAPLYPQTATLHGVEGDVKIDAVINENGHVGTMKILEGPMALRQAAMSAVSQWRYQPALLNGKAISSHLTVLVQFKLKK
jgi:protein TonB